MLDQNPLSKCATHIPTNMTTITPKAAGRVNNPKRMASPPKNSTKTATPVCQYSNPKFSCHDKAFD